MNVQDKIRKLLAMAADDSGASETERETALRQATALMDKHALSLEQVAQATDSDPRGRDFFPVGSRYWRRTVFSAIASLYGCECYRSGRGKRARIAIIGRESARVTVGALAAWLIASIEREASGHGLGRSYGESFRYGASQGVWSTVDKIQAARKAGDTVQATPGTALMVVGHYKTELAANEAWLRDTGIKLRTASAPSGPSDAGGYYSGKAYGSGLNLNRQVSGAGQRRLAR